MAGYLRDFDWGIPLTLDNQEFPTTTMGIEEPDGTVKKRQVFVDSKGNYYGVEKGMPIPVMMQHNLDEVVVTPSKEVKRGLLSDAFNQYLTMSNDKTKVNNVPHREYNTHLKDAAVRGAKDHALWDKQHPNLAAWRDAATAVPFAIVSAPLMDGVASTALGQGITRGLGFFADTAKYSRLFPWIDAAGTSLFGAKGLQDIQNGTFTPETALDVLPLAQVAKPMYELGKGLGIAAWHSPFAQYPRYYAGKLYYGNDVELPTLYRKIKAFPKTKDGKVLITAPDNRFIFKNGKESPVITNMTTDVPVRTHDSNWDNADTMVFSGKTLLGKHVISTRPSDTFTYGDNISVDPSKVTFLSGDKDAIAFAKNKGLNTITNNNLQKVIEESDRLEKLADEGKIVVEKPDWDSYTNEMQKITRSAFKSPTEKDYKFMDWVFQPVYKSEVFPAMDLSKSSISDLNSLPEIISSQLGNAKLRPYLLNSNEWRNVLYDPATSAEDNFRRHKGIILKTEYNRKHKNK